METGTIGFTTLDWVILIAYVAGSAALGSLFARGQKSSEDFFLAGRSLWWFPMALSVIATDFSAISFLGVPGYVVARDLVLEVQPLVFLWVLPLSQWLYLRSLGSVPGGARRRLGRAHRRLCPRPVRE